MVAQEIFDLGEMVDKIGDPRGESSITENPCAVERRLMTRYLDHMCVGRSCAIAPAAPILIGDI